MAEGFENRGDRMSTNGLDIEDKGISTPNDIDEKGVDYEKRTEDKLEELREGLKKPEDASKDDLKELFPQKNGDGKFRRERPDRFTAKPGELPSVLDEPEGPVEGEESVEKREDESQDVDREGGQKKEERPEAEEKKDETGKEKDYPRGEVALDKLLKFIVDNLRTEDFGEDLGLDIQMIASLEKLSGEVVAAAASNEEPSNDPSAAEKIASSLQEFSDRMRRDADEIKKYALSTEVSEDPEINDYAKKVKDEIKNGKSLEQAFSNVVGNTIANKFVDALVDEIQQVQ